MKKALFYVIVTLLVIGYEVVLIGLAAERSTIVPWVVGNLVMTAAILLSDQLLRKPWTILGRIWGYSEVVAYIKFETEKRIAEGLLSEAEAQEIWDETTERILRLMRPSDVKAQATRSMNWFKAQRNPELRRHRK